MTEAPSTRPSLSRADRKGWWRRAWSALANGLVSLATEDVWVARLLVAFVLLELAALGWDLPGAYGWENDGGAPRDLFGGIANNLTPGHGHRYPLFHYLLIGILSSPVLLLDAFIALARGFEIQEVVVSVPSMTAIALLAKLTSVTMMSVALLALARVFRNCFSTQAGRWAVLFAATNLSVGYYGRVTNMDGPYLMWTALAIDRLVLLAKRGRSSDYAAFAIFVAASMATKDQAYASYALTGPLYLIVLPLLQRHAFAAGARHFKQLARALGIGALGYAVLSGALFNPTGFVARLRMLTGTNSQDWKTYESTPAGWWANIQALFHNQPEFWWPWPVVAFAWLGVLGIARRAPRATQPGMVWRALPLVAGISSTVAFTLVVGRDAHRFVLPLGFWLAGYAGVAAAGLVESVKMPWLKRLGFAGAAALVGLGLAQSLELLVTQWTDPRRDVEAFLARQPAGTRVETYGLGVYLPRFDLSDHSPYSVTHVRADPKRRPPLIVGMHTIVDDYSRVSERRPDILVIPEAFAERFLGKRAEAHRIERKALERYIEARGALDFFPAAARNRLVGYERLEVGQVRLPRWYRALGGRAIRIHGSTGQAVWVLRRIERVRADTLASRNRHPTRL